MIHSTLKIPHNLMENHANSIILLSRQFSRYQLKVSREASGRLRGWITTHKTREVELKGLPAYLTRQQATRLLEQSYLKLQKEAIEVFPKGLGGMKPAEPCSLPEPKKMTICEEEILHIPTPSINDVYSLVEAIPDEQERSIVREAIERLVRNDPEETDCDLHSNRISPAGAKALGASLQVNQSLQSLNLEDNEIRGAGAQALGAALQVNQLLQSLHLGDNYIGDIGAQALGAALQVNQSLRWLDFGYNNYIGDIGAQALGTALQINQSLQLLALKSNQIGDAGTQALGTALQVNHTLQSLNLWNNQIGDAGAQALSAALQVNQSLQSLNLEYNQISATGAQVLGGALQVNRTLQVLNLGNNRIHDVGTQALGAALQVNQSLQSLDLSRNQIGAASAQALKAALEVNQSLQSLNLEGNKIGTAGAQTIGAALKVNQSLQSLHLSCNDIGNTGIQALGTALQVNHTLQTLTLANNPVSAEGIITKKQIDTLLQANKQMATLFQQQITQVQNFLQSHQNEEGILLEHLPQLKELLPKWHSDSQNLISSLQESLRQSGRTNLNDRYRKKLEGIIADLTNRLHNLWLEPFEKKVAALSNEYVMGKESFNARNVDLGYSLYETWLAFVGSDCPNWVDDHLQSLIPFGVLLDIAEGGDKQDVSELQNSHLLFQRVLSFRNESKDSLFSLTNQSQKS